MTPEQIFKGIKGIVKTKSQKNLVSEEVFNERKSICLNCENLRYKDKDDFNTYKCGGPTGCGCWLCYKLLLKDERCPLKQPKWDQVHTH